MELRSRTLPTTQTVGQRTDHNTSTRTPSDEEAYYSPGAQATSQTLTSSCRHQDADDSISHVSESIFSTDTVILAPDSPQNTSGLQDSTANRYLDGPPAFNNRSNETRVKLPAPPLRNYATNDQEEENMRLQAKVDSLYERLRELEGTQPREMYRNVNSLPADRHPLPLRQPHISYEEPDDFLFRNRERGRSRSRPHYNCQATDLDVPPVTNRSPSYSPIRYNQSRHRRPHNSPDESQHDNFTTDYYTQHRRSHHTTDYPEQGFRRRRHSPARTFDEPRQSMPYFYGKPNEWENFWMKFEILSRKYRWNEEKQRENLILAMRDDAAAFLTSLNAEVRENTRNFITTLRERFSHRTPARTHRAKLENIQKTPKESVQEYASRVQLMMSKAYSDIKCTTTYTDLAVQHLLKGLQDQQMAYEVSIRSPKSISEAADMIILHEACKNSSRRRNDVRQLVMNYEDDSLSEDSEDDTQLDLRRLNGKKFVTEDRLFQFARDLKQSLMRNKPTNNERNYQEVRKENQSKYTGTIICFNCQKEGHIAPRCPEKKDNPQQTQYEERINNDSNQQKSLNFKGLSLQAEGQSKQ